MTIVSVLIWNLLAPAALAASVVALARRLARAKWPGHWGVAAGLGLAYLVGHWGILGRPPFPGVDALHWVAWLAVAAAVLGAFEAARPLPAWATWLIRGLFVAALLGLVLGSEVPRWGAVQAVAWLVGLEAVLLASWWNLEAQAERIPGPGWMFHLGLVSAGWAAVQVHSGGASAGQLDGVLASAALGALPVVEIRSGPALSRGGPAVALAVLAGLGLAGTFYSYPVGVPAASAVLLILAPWAPWVDRIGPIRRRSPWTRAAVRGLAVLLAVGAAVLVAEAGGHPTPTDESSL
jgi:hypothetical protein